MREVEAGVRADHEDVAVGEVDELQDAVDHRVAERDQGVDRPDRDAVHEVLEELGHAARQVRPVSGELDGRLVIPPVAVDATVTCRDLPVLLDLEHDRRLHGVVVCVERDGAGDALDSPSSPRWRRGARRRSGPWRGSMASMATLAAS